MCCWVRRGQSWVHFLVLFIAGIYSLSYVNNIFAQIGLVMLIGLNTKNAILIVEFAKMKLEAGDDTYTAAIDGARLRFQANTDDLLAFILGLSRCLRHRVPAQKAGR